MTACGQSGKVQTVLGVISPECIGATLSHEHILWDAGFLFEEPEKKKLGYEPVKIENLDWLKHNSIGNIDNLKQLNEAVAINEILRFKQAGGGTIVDMGNIGLSRDPEGLVRVSHATGVHIVMGSGYYVGGSHPKHLVNLSLNELVDGMVQDITVGVADTGIKAGVLGEIGCSYPLRDTELKVLEAVARVQNITGAPVNIHPGRSQYEPKKLIELFQEFGGDVNRVAMSHLSNRYGMDVDLTVELAKTGCYIEYDSFGNYQNPISLPEKTFYALSDWQRIECIKQLIKKGYQDKLLISHDIFHKTDLKCYGGFGYDHIHKTVIPMMKMNGITEDMISAMLVKNPSNFLAFS
jgi:phosphotriesterase-related protein